MLLSMLVYVDSDSVHFFDADKLKTNLLDYCGELLKDPTSKNLELADKLLDLVNYINSKED